MTLQALRPQVGDRDFFRILRAWAARKAGGNGTRSQFIALAERISGEQPDDLFDVWLFTVGSGQPAPAHVEQSITPGGGNRPFTARLRPQRGPGSYETPGGNIDIPLTVPQSRHSRYHFPW